MSTPQQIFDRIAAGAPHGATGGFSSAKVALSNLRLSFATKLSNLSAAYTAQTGNVMHFSSFGRTNAYQAQLRYNYENHIGGQGLAAPAGSSLHETGQATDVIDPGAVNGVGPGVMFMRDNAASFGLEHIGTNDMGHVQDASPQASGPTLGDSGVSLDAPTTGPSDSPAVQTGTSQGSYVGVNADPPPMPTNSDASPSEGGSGASSFDSNSPLGQPAAPGSTGPATSFVGGGAGPGMFDSGSGSTDAPASAPAAATPAATSSPPIAGVTPGASATGNASAPTSKPSQGGGGQPVEVTNIKQEGIDGANAQASATQDLTKGIVSAEGSFAQTGTGWLGSIFSGITDTFVRSGFVLLGLVVLAGAFLFFYIDAQNGARAA